MLLKEPIPVKYVLGKIKKEIVLITLYAIAVAVLYHNFHVTRITIPIGGVPTILGTVLSLLLAFRSNQAYDRWWEARIIWGAIVNDSRTMSRQALSFIGSLYDAGDVHHFRERFIHRQAAWCYALSRSLRKQDPIPAIQHLLSPEEIDFVKRYEHAPGALLKLHAADLHSAAKQGWINEFQHVEMDRTLTRLTDAMGKCERIKNTVFPTTYSMYLSLALNLFIILLPFSLIEYFGLVEVPLVIAIASLFLLVEKMAIHLQDPFENKPTDTPMTTISRKIERDLKEMIQDHKAEAEASNQRKEGNEGEIFYVL